jgi:hypothetical protein
MPPPQKIREVYLFLEAKLPIYNVAGNCLKTNLSGDGLVDLVDNHF